MENQVDFPPPDKEIHKNKGFIAFLIVGPILLILAVVAYFVLKQNEYQLASLGFAGVITIISLMVIADHFFSKHQRLRRTLNEINSVTKGESLEKMKQAYEEIYDLYMGVSERHKRNFYTEVTEVRERIERKMRTVKKLEILVSNIGKGTIEQQKKNYEELHKIYTRLPDPMKNQYYNHLIHAKKLLEQGE